MSRHRNRNISYDDLSDDEDLYGSYDNSYTDPSLEQYMAKNKDKSVSLSSYVGDKGSEDDKLDACLDQIFDTLGDRFTEEEVIEAIMDANYNVEKAISYLLSEENEEDFFEMDNEDDDDNDDLILAKQKEAFKDKKPSSKPLNPVASSPNIIIQKTPQKQPSKPQQNNAKVNNNNINLNNQAKQSTPNLSTQKSGEFKPIVVATPPKKDLNRSTGSEGNLIYTPKKEIIQVSEAKRVQLLDEIFTSLKEVKDHLSLVVIGHVDAGKSTLMGHFLYLLGHVDQRTIHRYQTDSKKIGKASFAFAWVLDENEEERARGVTIDVGVNYFETDNKKFTLLDAPGHRDFIPNMITGAAQADAAVLVLASTAGEFESGFGADGQTKEHALLIRSLGVEQLIVAVNKLDTVGWSQERFNDIVNQAKVFLKQAGFKENKLTFIPCSGLTGENLIERKSDLLSSWYSGTTLAQAIDCLEAPKRTIDAPFRMCISDVFKNQLTGITVAGKIECGFIAPSHNLMKMPGNEIISVKSIRVRDENASWAVAGDNVELGISGIDFAILSSGFFLCSPEKPMKVTSRFQAKILTLTLKFPLTKGASVLIQYQNVTEEANVTKLLQTINKATGVIDKKFPRCLGDGVAALVEITTSKPICVELFSENKQYGRITLRDKGVTIASGVVTKLLKNKVTK